MSSMYWYWAFQSSEEFSALDTSFMAISFFAGSSRLFAAVAALARRASRSGAAARAPVRARKRRREVGVGVGPSTGRDMCTTVAPGEEWGVGVRLHCD